MDIQFRTALILPLFIFITVFSDTTHATPPIEVIDNFEDGDTSDWSFFGGNNAGGGGGPSSDRPYDGSFYFNTGWGGDGSASVFYGGAFKNFVNSNQVAIPANPWFNVWVYNQSNTSVDTYTLEITLREDADGNGWTNGLEDSRRLDTFFTASDFNDQWVLISAPLSNFMDLGTGGNGILEGNLDEIVFVIAGVSGGSPSTVEVDFDSLAFTSGGPITTQVLVFDDMEHGDPFANDWFAFGGSVGGGGIGPNGTDLPPTDGGIFSLESGWGSGGIPGFLGGFGRTNSLSISEQQFFSFWINPDAGQDFKIEINLQEDDNADNSISADDDEFQFNCEVSPVGPCAISGDGWQRVNIPLSDFFDDNSFLTGGNGVLDADPAINGQLINVVWAIISNSGADVTFRTDFWAFTGTELAQREQIIDDFEQALVFGVDSNGVPVGFLTFALGDPIAIFRDTNPPSPVPANPTGNNVLAMTADISAFAGFVHLFENATVDALMPQDWSSFAGFSVWVYGRNTGTDLFIDVLDNRNLGSTSDDAERFTVTFMDDFTGWQKKTFSFDNFVRKEIGNGAPNDGFNLTEVNGWAFGSLATPGELTFYLDNAALFGTRAPIPLEINYASNRFNIIEGEVGDITVALTRPMNNSDPAQVSVDYTTVEVGATANRDYSPASGTLTFVNGGPSELSFSIETLDDSKWEGDERIELIVSSATGAALGSFRSDAFITDNDPFNPALLDDFEEYPYLWDSNADLTLEQIELIDFDDLARPEQDRFEGVLSVSSPLKANVVINGILCNGKGKSKGNGVIPVQILSTDTFDATQVDHNSVMFAGAMETHTSKSGEKKRHEEDVDNDGDMDLVLHFRSNEVNIDCDLPFPPVTGKTLENQSFTSADIDASLRRDFALGDDWSEYNGISFWYFGSGNNAPITVNIKDNRLPDPGPSAWELTWSDEFNEPAGTPPNQANWRYELTDISKDGQLGWGNQELQYYTDELTNAATDGFGNLVISVTEADGSLACYYGPCEYTSARLITKQKAEFAYGRIEARIKLPDGSGIWPSFWSLGTDRDLVGWPQTGEIDFMEFVGRLPNEIFGGIHGPGYSGGQAFSGIFNFEEPAFNNHHTFTIEWEPDSIKWFVDGFLYHMATPNDVAPNEWVFNDPVYLLLNIAMGGNFGGGVDPNFEAPQSMSIDYIRVYQAADTAERFEAKFTDIVSGWSNIYVPFSDFTRSIEQPAVAPDDGLGLNDVWGYGFTLENGGDALIDQVTLTESP